MQLTLTMENKIVKIDRLLSDLGKITDCDYNGENGIEYCREDTIENGFKSDLEKDILDAIEKYEDTYKIIEYVINKCYESYYGFAYDIHKLNAYEYYVSVAYMD